MIYYKITDHVRGSFLATNFSVNYSQYHWVRGIGKLFVFDCLDNVRNFCGYSCNIPHKHSQVWTCEVRESEILATMANSIGNYERFWESFPHIPDDINVVETPTGTIVVSSLKLLERVC